MGAANSVRKLTVESIALLEQLEPNADEVQKKREVRETVKRLLAAEWSACRVLPFGSSESGIGFGGSDVDLGIYFDDLDVDYQNHLSVHERVQILRTAQTRLSDAFEVKEFVESARVPVLKLWDPTRQVACDVCVGGTHTLLNTALIKYYGQVDPRVRPLAFAVKYWAQRRGINDSVNGTLSSYGYALLVIFYLQSCHSPILLPSIHARFQALQSEKSLTTLLERLDAIPLSGPHVSSTFGTTSFQDSVGALLAGFFQFYATQFNWQDDVVSIRTGTPLAKTTKWSHPVPWRMSIEDPFELQHDIGRVIFNRKGQELLNNEFRRAFEMVCAGHRLHELCAVDATSWNARATCYICSSSEHKARECAMLQPKRMSSDEPSFLAECWYCGECGHFKATCPMLFFHHIPLHTEASTASTHTTVPTLQKSAAVRQPQRRRSMELVSPWVGMAQSQPIPIARYPPPAMLPQRILSPAPSVGVWGRGCSPPLSAKKKKRPRQGSGTSLALSPVLLGSPSLLPTKRVRRKPRHRTHSSFEKRQQQQRLASLCSNGSTMSISSGSSSGSSASGGGDDDASLKMKMVVDVV